MIYIAIPYRHHEGARKDEELAHRKKCVLSRC